MQQGRAVFLALALIGAAAAGLVTGYLIWGWPQDWYRADLAKLPQGAESDLIRYGAVRPVFQAPAAGLKPFAAPFISTFATFPMMADDQVLTLTERINGCMRRSMNGKDLPAGSHEMQALIAYVKFVGEGSPEGVRVAGMGLKRLPEPELAADATRGTEVYVKLCANCHKADGQGERRPAPGIGYSIPPLWGDQSFNAGAGMAKAAYAASYIHANMPFGIDYRSPVLTVQQAWDVAAYMTAQPRPPAPPEAASSLR